MSKVTFPKVADAIPNFVDTHGASHYSGWSESFLRKARCEGNIPGRTPGPPFIKIGRKVLYKIEDLDAWLDQHRRVV